MLICQFPFTTSVLCVSKYIICQWILALNVNNNNNEKMIGALEISHRSHYIATNISNGHSEKSNN